MKEKKLSELERTKEANFNLAAENLCDMPRFSSYFHGKFLHRGIKLK